MAESRSSSDVRLDVTAGRDPERGKPDPETPFRILVMGDFSGRSNRGGASKGPRPILIDRDNFDDVMAKLGVAVILGGEDSGIELRFQELDDFEPDRIYEKAALFRKLRDVRKPLSDPARFADTAIQYGLILGGGRPPSPRPLSTREPAAPRAEDLASGDLLSQMLDASEGGSSAARGPSHREDDLSAFLRRAVEPYAVQDPHPEQAEILKRWDDVIAGQMRSLLHHPDFQALEAAWRGLFLLARRLETGTDLKVYVLDITREELTADLRSPDLGSTRLYKALMAGSGDPSSDQPWSVLVGNYRFGASRDEVELLARLAKLAEYLGAPFLSEAKPDVLGCTSIQDLNDPSEWSAVDPKDKAAWNALRSFPEARYLTLAAPRFLLRLPYGRETVPTEEFPFEESPESHHDDFLWGNPAFACACLLGMNFSQEGWDMVPGSLRRLDGVPLHVYKTGPGQTEQVPGAEAWVGEKTADVILEAGITPILSVKGQDAVVLFDFRPVTKTVQGVAGPWSS